MTADRADLRFFFDESALGVGKALAIARKDVIHTGHPLIPEVPMSTEDCDWMPVVANRNLIAVLRDKHIRTKPAEVASFRDHGLRVFWLAGKKDKSTWEYLVLMVRLWNRIEKEISNRGAGPWFIAINEGSLKELTLRGARIESGGP